MGDKKSDLCFKISVIPKMRDDTVVFDRKPNPAKMAVLLREIYSLKGTVVDT